MISTVDIFSQNPACASIKTEYVSSQSVKLLLSILVNYFPRVLKRVIPR